MSSGNASRYLIIPRGKEGINRAYTKHHDIHGQESSRKSGFLYFPLQSPIQFCVVMVSDIEISSLLNQNPLKHSKQSKSFFAICFNLFNF